MASTNSNASTSRISRRGFVTGAAALAAGLGIMALAGCGNDASSTSGGSSAGSSAASTSAAGGASTASGGKQLRFVTGGESGTYYAFGSVIAQHATNNTPYKVTALSGNGSQANVVALQDNEAELAFCQSDVMSYAYQGSNLFASTGAVDCFSVLGALYQEQVQIVTCNADIKSVADLAGKKVSVGAKGSGVYFNALDILGVYGIGVDDSDDPSLKKDQNITPTYQSFGDSANDLKDEKIDAAFIVAGYPTTAITDLSTSKTAYLVALDDDHVAQLLDASPYYSKATIPAGTYTGLDTDTTTVAVEAVVIVRDDVEDDAVYAIAADIFDNAPNLVESHAKYAEVSVETGASITSVPYHPGAAKYFAEKGYSLETKNGKVEATGAASSKAG